MVKFVNAYALIEGDSKYLSFIDYVNTAIVHYKREVIGQKSGSAQTSGTTGRTTGGGSTGGSTGGTISDGTTPPSVEIVSFSKVWGERANDKPQYLAQLHTDYYNKVGHKYGLARGFS